MAKAKKEEPKPDILKGWAAIAQYLGQPVSVVQRWSNEGMPVTKEGRYVHAVPEEITQWIGNDSGKGRLVRIASENENLADDLKKALSYVREEQKKVRR